MTHSKHFCPSRYISHWLYCVIIIRESIWAIVLSDSTTIAIAICLIAFHVVSVNLSHTASDGISRAHFSTNARLRSQDQECPRELANRAMDKIFKSSILAYTNNENYQYKRINASWVYYYMHINSKKQGRIHSHKSLLEGRNAKVSRTNRRTDRQTDGRTDITSYGVASSR